MNRARGATVLLVEDELKVAHALRLGLETEGYQTAVAHSVSEAGAKLAASRFDVVLLDLGLPDGDGLDLLTSVRKRGVDARMLVLTARDALEARVRGLDAGADDYLVKPFAFAELLARIRALERRGRPASPPTLTISDLHMDVAARMVTRAGQPIELTAREFSLLEHLLRCEGEVVSRDTIVREVWHEGHRSPTFDNIIDVHIARLRRKIDLNHPVRLIHTVRGVGFIVQEGTS